MSMGFGFDRCRLAFGSCCLTFTARRPYGSTKHGNTASTTTYDTTTAHGYMAMDVGVGTMEFRLFNGPADSVGNHLGGTDNKMLGELGNPS